jgi:predicted amidophosphoribosyltransferase
MICPHCGTKNKPDAVFCKSCGKKLVQPKVCDACGGELEGDETFCPHCGKKLK